MRVPTSCRSVAQAAAPDKRRVRWRGDGLSRGYVLEQFFGEVCDEEGCIGVCPRPHLQRCAYKAAVIVDGPPPPVVVCSKGCRIDSELRGKEIDHARWYFVRDTWEAPIELKALEQNGQAEPGVVTTHGCGHCTFGGQDGEMLDKVIERPVPLHGGVPLLC